MFHSLKKIIFDMAAGLVMIGSITFGGMPFSRNLGSRKFVEEAVGRRAVGRLITTSGI
jgi:hypothetical protein